MTLDDIEQIIRRDHGGAWYMLFHTAPGGYRFLPTATVLTPRAYQNLVRRFTGTPAPLTPEERKRNAVRAKAGGEYR